jgi:hypothetical protein
MSNGRSEDFQNFVLILIAVGIGIGGVVYVLYLFWPYFVFYVLPFLLGSLAIGGILRYVTLPSEDSNGLMNYKALAWAFPVMILVAAVVFFANEERAIILNKAGRPADLVRLDWPELNKTFNDWRSSIYRNSPFDSLKASAHEQVIYDRQELGWIMLWCLFLGGPAFFYYLTRDDFGRDAETINNIVQNGTRQIRDRVDERESKIKEIVASNIAPFKKKIAEVEAERDRLEDENRVFKARVEFSPDIPRPPESVKTGGVLDRDIL